MNDVLRSTVVLCLLAAAHANGCKGDCKNGQGMFKSKNGQYVGDWKNSRKHGRGKATWPSGETYDGDWSEHIQHGKGTYIWKNGRKYEGEWKNGQMDGRGILYENDGSILWRMVDGTKYTKDYREL